MFTRRGFISGSAVVGSALIGGSIAKADLKKPSEFPGYSYACPKFKPGTRLLFQGDSITDMSRGRNESDRNHYLGHSYVYLIAARLGLDAASDKLEFFNRGVSGNTVADLKKRWQTDAVAVKPDLLSILIGVNDVWRLLKDLSPKDWEADYRFILDASRQANPDLKIVLLDPFVLASGKLAQAAEYKKWRTQIELLLPIVEQLSKDYDAVHIKTQVVFDEAASAVSPEHWIWDGVHPLPQGHELIARKWLETVSSRWDKA